MPAVLSPAYNTSSRIRLNATPIATASAIDSAIHQPYFAARKRMRSTGTPYLVAGTGLAVHPVGVSPPVIHVVE